ncbi:MAG TPA: sigma-70 family RNA polymerase sigma factor, partial [Dehalococcoidia bacterium]|nr:sigma-70 family RNA polymerase sigma factor [Dehalococcoidia bacterium]
MAVHNLVISWPVQQKAEDDKAFADIYSQYFHKVFSFTLNRLRDKEAAADVTATVFEKAFQKCGALRSRDALGSWLFTIARNELVSYWRKERPANQIQREFANGAGPYRPALDPEETLLHKERAAAIARLI